ncbi:MAG: hypothetical protein ABSB84_10300 [Verrucomicrobiota bacterium]
MLVEPHDFQGSRLFSPRAFSVGGAAWRLFSEGENQSFAMPVSITNFGRFGNAKFFKKPLALKRIFDIFPAPFRSEGRMVSMGAGR